MPFDWSNRMRGCFRWRGTRWTRHGQSLQRRRGETWPRKRNSRCIMPLPGQQSPRRIGLRNEARPRVQLGSYFTPPHREQLFLPSLGRGRKIRNKKKKKKKGEGEWEQSRRREQSRVAPRRLNAGSMLSRVM